MASTCSASRHGPRGSPSSSRWCRCSSSSAATRTPCHGRVTEQAVAPRSAGLGGGRGACSFRRPATSRSSRSRSSPARPRGANRDDLQESGWALSLHLWFLAPYLLLLLLTPALLAAHRRYGVAVPLVMAATAVVIDVGVIEEHWHFVGWANYVLVWGTFHQLGFAWHEGFLTGRRGRASLLAGGAIVTAVALIWWGPYPVSMVGVPGARIQNASPPSAALLAFGLAQVGLVLLAAPSVTAWLARPDRGRLCAMISACQRNDDAGLPLAHGAGGHRRHRGVSDTTGWRSRRSAPARGGCNAFRGSLRWPSSWSPCSLS